jgi:hypothetical protein
MHAYIHVVLRTCFSIHVCNLYISIIGKSLHLILEVMYVYIYAPIHANTHTHTHTLKVLDSKTYIYTSKSVIEVIRAQFGKSRVISITTICTILGGKIQYFKCYLYFGNYNKFKYSCRTGSTNATYLQVALLTAI